MGDEAACLHAVQVGIHGREADFGHEIRDSLHVATEKRVGEDHCDVGAALAGAERLVKILRFSHRDGLLRYPSASEFRSRTATGHSPYDCI
jgi:hypothetical protein